MHPLIVIDKTCQAGAHTEILREIVVAEAFDSEARVVSAGFDERFLTEKPNKPNQGTTIAQQIPPQSQDL